MESYKSFLERINSFEKKEIHFGDEYFMVNASVSQKVDRNNKFQSFFGDTIVFKLDDATKQEIAGMVERIYDIASECFCEKLVSNTFHMTLHDLSNSSILENIAVEVFENELKVLEKSKQLCLQKIRMRSKYIFNMVNTSLVLGLYPVNEEEYNKLMDLYYLFEDVKKLDYPFTPHITLAYYNSNGFDMESARKLEHIVQELNANEIEIELDTKELFYQKFVSMNEYINIVNLVGVNNLQEATERIRQMERYFDTLQNAVRTNPDALREDASTQVMLQILTQYYQGGQWLQDYELDEKGLLPQNLKRGVLAQDAVYDFLHRIKDIVRGAQ